MQSERETTAARQSERVRGFTCSHGQHSIWTDSELDLEAAARELWQNAHTQRVEKDKKRHKTRQEDCTGRVKENSRAPEVADPHSSKYNGRWY